MVLAGLQVRTLMAFTEARIVRSDPASSAQGPHCDFELVKLGALLSVADLTSMLADFTLDAGRERRAHIR